MIGRILWLVALICVAFITAQLQFDRQSARQPEIGRLVTPPFRGNVQERAAREAIVLADPVRALEETRQLVRRRPIPAENLTLLAGAQLQAGEIEQGLLTIQQAAARGWREPASQEARARLAIENGDEAEAARRFVALMILGNSNTQTLQALAEEIFVDPTGPAVMTLVEIIGETDRWQSAFLQRGAVAIPPQAFAAIVIDATSGNTQFACAQLERAARVVGRRDRAAGQALEDLSPSRCAARQIP